MNYYINNKGKKIYINENGDFILAELGIIVLNDMNIREIHLEGDNIEQLFISDNPELKRINLIPSITFVRCDVNVRLYNIPDECVIYYNI